MYSDIGTKICDYNSIFTKKLSLKPDKTGLNGDSKTSRHNVE